MATYTVYIGNDLGSPYPTMWRSQGDVVTCFALTSGIGYAEAGSKYPRDNKVLTLPANEYPVSIKCTVNGTFGSYKSDYPGWYSRADIYLCDSNGQNLCFLKRVDTSDESVSMTVLNTSGDWKSLQGKTLALTKRYTNEASYYNHTHLLIFNQATFVITTAIATTACGAPSNVSLSSSISEGNVTLSWSAGSAGVGNAVTGYQIQYRDSSNGGASWGGWADYTTTTGTSISVAPPGTRGYHRQFAVRTMGAAGASYYSGYAYSGTLQKNQYASSPTGLSASPSIFEGAISLSWNASSSSTSSISRYELSYRTSSNNSSWSGWSSWINNGTSRSYSTTPSLTRGYYIQYKVRAVDAFGVGGYEGTFASLRKNVAPSTPGGLSASPSIFEGSISLSWNASTSSTSSISRYDLSYRTSSNNSSWGAWSAWASNGTSRTYSVTPSLTRGYYIQYKVRAVDAFGVGSGEATFASLRKNVAPSAPGSLSVSPAVFEGEISLSWGASSSSTSTISRYELSYRTSSNNSSWGSWSAWTSNSTSRSASPSPSLTRGYYIQYKVRAVDAFGVASSESTFSSVRKNLVPNAPTGISASPALWESGDITLSWTASAVTTSSISYYQIALDASNDGSQSGATNVGNVTSKAVSAPSFNRGAQIKYYVRAVDTFGVASEWAATNIVKRNSLPSVPTGVAVNKTRYEGENITISWDAASDSDSNLQDYVIQYAVSSNGSSWGSWTDLTTTENCSTTHSPSLTVLPRGSYIKYRVASKDALGAMSSYAESSAVRKNRLPIKPEFVLPVSANMQTATPAVKISFSAEPDGSAQTVTVWAMKGNTKVWEVSRNVGSAAGTICFRTSPLSEGEYIFYAKTTDDLVDSEMNVSLNLTLTVPSYSRSIASGDVISDETISHKADITEMFDMINAKRQAYGLSLISLDQSTENGWFAKWQVIMERFAAGIRECYMAVDENPAAVSVTSQYPSAAVVNAIRNLISGA